MPVTKDLVLVAVDFSEFSLSAIKEAREYVSSPDSLHLVHVLPELSAVAPGVSWSALDNNKRRRTTETALKEQLPAGLDGVHLHVAIGNPGREVARCARELNADLLVVSSHGRTGLKRAFIGSVAETIVRHAPSSVLVIHANPHAD